MTDVGVQFTKLYGAGNGYIVIDGRGLPHDWAALAPQMTDPHFGIGSDGRTDLRTA